MEGLVQAQVQQAIEGQVLAAAQQMEDALDEKLHECVQHAPLSGTWPAEKPEGASGHSPWGEGGL